jgi:hypothetical protein
MRGSLTIPSPLKKAFLTVYNVLLALLAQIRHQEVRRKKARGLLRSLKKVRAEAGTVIEFRREKDEKTYLFPLDSIVISELATGALALKLRAPDRLFHAGRPMLVFYPDCLCWTVWLLGDPDPCTVEIRVNQKGPWHSETCPAL